MKRIIALMALVAFACTASAHCGKCEAGDKAAAKPACTQCAEGKKCAKCASAKKCTKCTADKKCAKCEAAAKKDEHKGHDKDL